MIYESKRRAMEAARNLNATMPGCGEYRAARVQEGWTVRIKGPYSNGDVLEWAPLRPEEG